MASLVTVVYGGGLHDPARPRAIGRPVGLSDVEWRGGNRALTPSLAFAAFLAAALVAARF